MDTHIDTSAGEGKSASPAAGAGSARSGSSPTAPPPLAPRARIGLLSIGLGLYALGGPGVLSTGGSVLGLLGFAFWAAAVARPGRRAKRIEWLVTGLFLGLQLTWIGYVFWPTLPYIFLGAGAYGLLGGVLLRSIQRVLPLGLAAGFAWVGTETLRAIVPPPFGMGWLRAGHYFQLLPDWLGSARVWGVVGLSFAGVAAAGALAELWLAHKGVIRLRWGKLGPALAVLPLLLAPLLARLVPAPQTEAGPRLLLVQPGFEQKRKQQSASSLELFEEQRKLTIEGLAALDEAPDLVCWGETMLTTSLIDESLREQVMSSVRAGREHGIVVDPWYGLGERPLDYWVEWYDREEAVRIGGGLFRSVLPRGTRFLCGAERLTLHEGRLRRQNTIGIWGPRGVREGVGEKRHLAPGGETMLGAERFQLVRDVISALANYVPDFLAGERTGVLALPTRSGREYKIAASACFDNAFVDVYLEPVAREPVDFHVIASNEAWFRKSQEYDQMLAFSRFAAVMSGRSLVRATNGGVSAAYDPQGREIARLVVAGEDRLVRGTLLVQPPVPVPGEGVPPYARTHRLWRYGAVIVAFLFAAIGVVRKRNSRVGSG